MGIGKPDVNIPEAYELSELVDAAKESNRFDSFNPWGSQTWNADKTAMTQSVNPELQAAVDKNIAFANRDAPVYNTPWRLSNAGMGMMSEVMGRAGMGEGLQGLVSEANPRQRKMTAGQAYPPTPELPQQQPAAGAPVQAPGITPPPGPINPAAPGDPRQPHTATRP